MSSKHDSAGIPQIQESVLFGATVASSNVFYDGIIQELRSKKWDVHVVSSPGPTGHLLFGHAAQIHALKMERALSPLRDLISLVQWVRLLIEVRPQVLVLGTPKASLLGGLAARITRTPHIVYVVHGLRAQLTTGLLGRVLVGAERITLRSAHHVVAVSESLRREVEQSHPEFRNRIELLGFGSMNGVDMTRFTPASADQRASSRQQWGLPASAFVVGFVGRLNYDKGGSFLASLMRDEASRRLGLHLLVVGTVEDEALRIELDELASQRRITITGWVDDPESLLAGMDLLLHPTLREGLGMVLLEAQAAGIPVLTNRVTGTEDAVENGVGGFFADTDSIPSWIDQITTLVMDEQKRQVTGRRGRAFVMERYDRTIVVPRFAEYLSVLNSSSEQKISFGKKQKRKSAK